jgi:hypothetical protein
MKAQHMEPRRNKKQAKQQFPMLVRLISQIKRAKDDIVLEASGQICRIVKKALATRDVTPYRLYFAAATSL